MADVLGSPSTKVVRNHHPGMKLNTSHKDELGKELLVPWLESKKLETTKPAHFGSTSTSLLQLEHASIINLRIHGANLRLRRPHHNLPIPGPDVYTFTVEEAQSIN